MMMPLAWERNGLGVRSGMRATAGVRKLAIAVRKTPIAIIKSASGVPLQPFHQRLDCVQASLRHSTSLYLEISQMHYEIPVYVKALFLLPFTLTMAITWKAKERCFACLDKS